MTGLVALLPDWPRAVWIAIAIVVSWWVAMGEESYR